MGLKTLCLVVFFVPKLSIAGGTLGTEDLSALMGQKPEIRDFLRSSLRLSDSAYAEVRFGPQFINLSGARMGPYTIEATPLNGGKSITVVLCTRARFLDSKGRELRSDRIEQAVSVEEKLTGVMLRQEDDNMSQQPC